MMLNVQIPTEVRGRPRFEKVDVANVPRVGDTVEIESVEHYVSVVMWEDLTFSRALVILDVAP